MTRVSGEVTFIQKARASKAGAIFMPSTYRIGGI